MPASHSDRDHPGLPARDGARVRQLALTTHAHDFGEEARRALVIIAERVRAEIRSGELTEALAVLHHLRAGLESLHPSALSTRRGLGGLFDSRSRRLKTFRARFGEATRTLSESLDDLQVRIGAMTRRSSVMERLWGEMRAAIVEADVFAAAALMNHRYGLEDDIARPMTPLIAETPSASPVQAASGASSPGEVPRGHRLADARDAALRVLPQIRVAQNADSLASHRLKLACDAMLDWHHDWSAGLGVGGKRPKTIKPDTERLTMSRDTVLAMLNAAAREVDVARQRRVEADTRIDAARRDII